MPRDREAHKAFSTESDCYFHDTLFISAKLVFTSATSFKDELLFEEQLLPGTFCHTY